MRDVTPAVDRESLTRMGIPPDEKRNIGAFSEGQRRYLEYHLDLVFLKARVRRKEGGARATMMRFMTTATRARTQDAVGEFML